jgi:hypothetical protein
MQTVVCMKWGDRYPSDYANRLLSMIKRNTNRPTRLICFTDDPVGLDPEIIVHPLPPIAIPERVQWKGWRKVSLWQAPLVDLEGDVLFLDLDIVITGPMDDFFDYEPGKFCIAENWSQRGAGIGNTTIYRWRVGTNTHVFEDFIRNGEALVDRYKISQKYISAVAQDMVYWPNAWTASFKFDLLPRWPLNFFKTPELPAGVRVVAFTGKPDPDEAAIGEWPVKKGWKKLYKHVRPTPWIETNWR